MTRSITMTAFALILLAACASRQKTIESAERGLGAALGAVNATREVFVAWDAARQEEIVAAATSLDAGKVALAKHRALRGRLAEAFVLAYSSIALASSTLALYAVDKVSQAEVIARLIEVSTHVRAVVEAVNHIRGKL